MNFPVKKNISLAELVGSHNELLPVLSRFDIRLGFGDDSIEEICLRKNIDYKFFLLVVNTVINSNYFPEDELKEVNPSSLLDYLRKTHLYYLEYVLPEIDSLFDKLTSQCKGNCTSLGVIVPFYKKYRNELLQHIMDEEDRVFPYIEQLITVSEKKTTQFETDSYRIESFEKEHSNVEEKIADLKSILIKHLKANYNQNICNEFIYSLSRFETDISNHARIEDKILIPVVKEIEDTLTGSKRFNKNKRLSIEDFSNRSPGPVKKTTDEAILSPRETEVLRLVAMGLSNKEIAARLFISMHTVISHRKNITTKLGIRSISGLTVFAIINDIIDTRGLDPASLV